MLSKITRVVCAISSFRGKKTPDEMMPRKTWTSISSQYGEHSVKRSHKKKPAFCDRDMKRIPSLYMQRTNGHSYVRGESRVIVLFLCTSSDHVLYFKVWPWRSLTDLVIMMNSANHLSIRKLQKSFHWWRRYGADTRSKMTDGYMMDRQTDKTGKQTNGQHNN